MPGKWLLAQHREQTPVVALPTHIPQFENTFLAINYCSLCLCCKFITYVKVLERTCDLVFDRPFETPWFYQIWQKIQYRQCGHWIDLFT